MSDNLKIGMNGENSAAAFYEQNGFHILARNYRSGHDEIDLIAENDTTVVFVEVKTRNATIPGYGRPSLAVNKKKRQCLIRCAQAYIRQHKSEKWHRFDVIEIYIDENGNEKLTHIRNAFGADGKVI